MASAFSKRIDGRLFIFGCRYHFFRGYPRAAIKKTIGKKRPASGRGRFAKSEAEAPVNLKAPVNPFPVGNSVIPSELGRSDNFP